MGSQLRERQEKERGGERGALVIEATLSLSTFIFLIFTLLSITNIYYIQAKMSVALNSSAKEISQYMYLYYKLGLDDLESTAASATDASRDTVTTTIDGVQDLVEAFSDGSEAAESLDFDSLITEIQNGTTTVNSLVDTYAEAIGDDPKQFIIGMAKLAALEGVQEIKEILAQVLAKTFMKNNLIEYEGDSADNMLARYRVVNGMDGLDFNYSSLMAYGKTDQIFLVVTYDVSVIRFLNIDVSFTFRQCAKTSAWDTGVSSK
ncbi:MAG: hypothetical protein LUE29_11110 [Lachnospiraceae bacterium]|nr:hypothetical protein [Lachnospiraceae bacterium]